jgi:glyoxylase-like metal-dependent hydrolase (beta-lactamase superfamily II)
MVFPQSFECQPGRGRPYPEQVARVDILFEGYLGRPDHRVASTLGLVRDGDTIVVIDPGLVPEIGSILNPLAEHGVYPESVTDVVFSHHHPDHTLNAALFPGARFHDHWAIYQGDLWTSREAEGFRISPGVFLIRVPGHTSEDIATVVETDDGLVVFTHAWTTADQPVENPFTSDPAALHASRARILEMNPRLIVPGHGAPFEPGPQTPR